MHLPILILPTFPDKNVSDSLLNYTHIYTHFACVKRVYLKAERTRSVILKFDTRVSMSKKMVAWCFFAVVLNRIFS